MGDNKRKILFLIQVPPPIHGASTMNRFVYETICSDNNFETRLIKLDFAKNLSDLQKVRFGKIVKAFTILFKLIFQLFTYRPNVVYFSMIPLKFVIFRDSLYLLIVKLLAPKAKPVLHFHRPGLLEFNKKYHLTQLYRFLFRGCTIIHLTESLVKREIEPLRLKNAEVFAIPNCIDCTPCSSTSQKDEKKILFLSNLMPSKGYDKVIISFALLCKEVSGLSLTIAGLPPTKETIPNIKSLVSSLNLEGKVEIIGGVYGYEKQKLFQRASIFVLPSESDYFPLVILEAMAEKVVVVTSGRESLQCMFTDFEEILYLDDSNPRVIADKLRLLIENPMLRERIAENGFKKSKHVQAESINRIKNILSN